MAAGAASAAAAATAARMQAASEELSMEVSICLPFHWYAVALHWALDANIDCHPTWIQTPSLAPLPATTPRTCSRAGLYVYLLKSSTLITWDNTKRYNLLLFWAPNVKKSNHVSLTWICVRVKMLQEISKRVCCWCCIDGRRSKYFRNSILSVRITASSIGTVEC